MNKKIFFSFLLIISVASKAQVREILEAVKPKKEFAGTPVLQKNSQVFYASIGAPDKIADFLNFGGGASFFLTITAKKSAGPFMLEYEYFIKDNIGLGLSLLHASANQTYQSGSNSFTGSIKQYQVGISTYYHPYITGKLDPYIKGTIGINIWDGYYKNKNCDETKIPITLTPLGVRSNVGLRYFPGKNLGLIGEANLTLLPKLSVAANIGAVLKLK
jgi:outer membrane protein W